jgi:hypothetical protein
MTFSCPQELYPALHRCVISLLAAMQFILNKKLLAFIDG